MRKSLLPLRANLWIPLANGWTGDVSIIRWTKRKRGSNLANKILLTVLLTNSR